MAVTLSSGYQIRIARDCTKDATVFGDIILIGDDGITRQDIVRLSARDAIELATQILRSVSLGMDD